jgi:hypothetical protein
MLCAGLDLSRKRLDFHLLDGEGATIEVGAAPPDVDGLRQLTTRLDRHGEPIRAAIESMKGARFVHDRLDLPGLAGGDRRRTEGEGAGGACVQDRPHQGPRAGRARTTRSGAGDLATGPARARRARAGTLAPASRPSPLEPEAARAGGAAHARQALSRLRSLRRPRPAAARPARPPGPVAGNDRGESPADRRARPRDQRARARAPPARRRPPVRAAASHRARHQLPPSSATSPASPARASPPATAASARASTIPFHKGAAVSYGADLDVER